MWPNDLLLWLAMRFKDWFPQSNQAYFFVIFSSNANLKFHICTEYCLGSQMFSQRCEAPYSLKSNNLRQFAPYRVTKKVYFKFVECIFFSIKCKNKKKEALQYLFKCNDNEQFVFVLCISNNYIWKKIHMIPCVSYIVTLQHRLTSLPSSCMCLARVSTEDTVLILQLDFPSHVFLLLYLMM